MESSNQERAFTSVGCTRGGVIQRMPPLELGAKFFFRMSSTLVRGFLFFTDINIIIGTDGGYYNIKKQPFLGARFVRTIFRRGFKLEIFYRQSIKYDNVPHNWYLLVDAKKLINTTESPLYTIKVRG